jgi:predicted MPP superfamily phosphohydrolase
MTDLGNGRKLVVSRGIGMERGGAPRLRFLCRPEVIVIDLLPLQQARDASN